MCNAFKTIAVVSLMAMTLYSCGNDKQRETDAQALVEQASALRERGDYGGAIALLDTLDTKYRDCRDQRREALRLRVETLMSMSADSLKGIEEQRPALVKSAESLAGDFVNVTMPGTEGYRVARVARTGNEMNVNTVQARIDEKDYFFIMVNVTRPIGLNAVTFGKAVAKGTSLKMDGSELMTLSQEDCTALAEAVAAAPAGSPVTFDVCGTRGNVKVKLNARQADAFRNTWAYANALQQIRLLNIRGEKYAQQIDALQTRLAAMESETEPVADTEE